MPLGRAGYVPLQRARPLETKFILSSGCGGSALQEVPEKLKATCGQLLVGPGAKNNLGREQKDSACHPCPCKTSEGALSALPEAPVQGGLGHCSTLHICSSSPGTTHCPDTPPTLSASRAQILGVLLNCLLSLCLPSPPSPLPVSSTC